MNRWFLAAAVVFQLVLTGVFLVFDVRFNDQTEIQLFRVGIYTLIVACSWMLALSALATVSTKHRRGVLRWATWPPEWDRTVALWAVAKSIFFSVLWSIGMGFVPPGYVLTAGLLLFAEAHVLFTAQWLDINRHKENQHDGN